MSSFQHCLQRKGYVRLQLTRELMGNGMKRVSIVGLGWLGTPLAMALKAAGWQVSGSKTTADGVAAARLCGINSYQLTLTPEPLCDADVFDELFSADTLVITLPAGRSEQESATALASVQQVVDSALAYRVPHLIFTSSTAVYGQATGVVNELTPRQSQNAVGRRLIELEDWLHLLPGIAVDILRLSGLVGPDRHPGRFLAGKQRLSGGAQCVNLVHLDDVVAAILLLLEKPQGGNIYNLSAPVHPTRQAFYTAAARQLLLIPPTFLSEAINGSGKIIDGGKICRERGFHYRWPDPMQMGMT